MKKIMCICITALMVVCLMAGARSYGQEEESGIYTYGTVVSVSGDTLTINEVFYDEDTGEELTETVSYKVLPETKIENAASITEIKAGKEVDIEYLEKDGKNQVTYLYVYSEGEV